MDDRFNKVTQDEVDEANRFYDRILDWRKRNGVSQKVIRSISENRDRKASISTVFAVQILISNGRELEASYNGYDGDICCNAGFYYVAVEKNGEKFIYSTSDLDDFGKNAKFGPYPLKDVVDKWDVHFAQIDVRQWNGVVCREIVSPVRQTFFPEYYTVEKRVGNFLTWHTGLSRFSVVMKKMLDTTR